MMLTAFTIIDSPGTPLPDRSCAMLGDNEASESGLRGPTPPGGPWGTSNGGRSPEGGLSPESCALWCVMWWGWWSRNNPACRVGNQELYNSGSGSPGYPRATAAAILLPHVPTPSLWFTRSIALRSVLVNLGDSFWQFERLFGRVAINDSIENGRKFLDLCWVVCVDKDVDSEDVGGGCDGNCSLLNVVSMVTMINNYH